MPSNYLILCLPLLFLPSIFPASGSFPVSQFFTSGSQSIEASASVLPMNIQGWFPLGLIGLMSLQFKGLSSFIQHHSLKAPVLQCSAFFLVQLSHPYMTTRKTIALTRWTIVSKMMSQLFNKLSGFVIAFFPRGKCLFISWLQSLSTVILEPRKTESAIVSTFFPSVCHDGTRRHDLSFWNVEF